MKFDTIIVGGGIIGCALAFYLSRKGMKVAIVEKSLLGSGTSANNFSWANATSKTSDSAYHYLNASGVRMYDALIKEFGSETLGINPTGAIGIVQKSATSDYAAMREQANTLKEFGYPCEWIGVDRLRTLEPNINFTDDTEAIFTPADKIVDTGLFIRFLADQVIDAGGRVFENCLAQEILADDNGEVAGLATSTGDMASTRLIVATGPDTPEVLSELTGFDGFSSRFPVQKVPGLLLTTPPVQTGLLRHLVYTSAKNELHFLPDFNGGLRIGSDDIDGLIIEDQSCGNLKLQRAELLRRTKAYIPDFAGEALIDECKLEIGIRAYPEDGKTIAGPMPGSEGLYVIATHSGITLAPAIGSLMAEVVSENAVPDALQPFLLDRLEGFA